MSSFDSKAKPPKITKSLHSKQNSKLSGNNVKTFEIELNEKESLDEEQEEEPQVLDLKMEGMAPTVRSIDSFVSFEHNPIMSARSM